MIPHSVHTPPNHSTGGGDVQRESKRRIASRFNRERQKGTSHAGNRTRIGRVRACYPNRLDYMGPVSAPNLISIRLPSHRLEQRIISSLDHQSGECMAAPIQRAAMRATGA